MQPANDVRPDPTKAAVRCATTGAGTLASSFEAGLSIDGTAVLADGDRILIKDQVDATENGIYVVTDAAPVRAIDANQRWKLLSGFIVTVQEGPFNGGRSFMLASPDPVEIGTSALEFLELGGPQESIEWTPSISGGSGFNLGTGAAQEGHYQWSGTRTWFDLSITFGSSPNPGSAIYKLGLPRSVVGGRNLIVGSGSIVDASAGGLIRLVSAVVSPAIDVDEMILLVEGGVFGGGSNPVASTVPWTWAAGDGITLMGSYESAVG